jgi:hypothetical protein
MITQYVVTDKYNDEHGPFDTLREADAYIHTAPLDGYVRVYEVTYTETNRELVLASTLRRGFVRTHVDH